MNWSGRRSTATPKRGSRSASSTTSTSRNTRTPNAAIATSPSTGWKSKDRSTRDRCLGRTAEILAADPGPGENPIERARAVLRPLVLRVWRRPAEASELRRLTQFVAARIEAGERMVDAIHTTLQALLLSPNFLFRVERGPAPERSAVDPNPTVPRELQQAPVPVAEPLDDYALATRLSLFLWSSVPDAELLERARSGELHDPRELRRQAERMLRDARASRFCDAFSGQWLELRSVPEYAPDPDLYPEFDPALVRAFAEETRRLFECVLRERRPLRELVEADFTFVDERLATHYGIAGVRGAEFRRVRVEDPRRRGILAHGSFLSVTSHATRTSPVLRGKWLLENLLGAPPPPPPPGADNLVDEGEFVAGLSLRQRLEQHRADPACATCHQRMDALGFALEHFDVLGRWRDSAAGLPIDSAGELPDGTRIDGPLDLRRQIASDPGLVRCVFEKLSVYAVGRGFGDLDGASVDLTVRALGPDPSLHDVVLAVVDSVPFRQRRPAPTASE